MIYLLILLSTVGFSFIFLVGIRLFFVVITVQGDSMSPTLIHGSQVLVLRHCPASLIKRGHIVFSQASGALAMTAKQRLAHKDNYIKRVVGLPGDTLTVHLSELPPEWQRRERDKYDQAGYRTWQIPPGHYFLRGDGISTDSLIWGPIPMKACKGIMIARLPGQSQPGVAAPLVSPSRHLPEGQK